MNIIDKRKSGKNQSVGNRQKFIKRYKDKIKESIDQSGNITDSLSKRKATVSKRDIDEPDFNLDPTTGKRSRVYPGNKKYSVGNTIKKDKKKAGQRGNAGQGEDDFNFVLTKEEFMSLYFEDMALPDFVKKSLKDNSVYKMVRSGFSKEGIPPRLDVLRTFKQAIARHIATSENEDETEIELDDVDLRYKYFVKKPIPMVKAHIFFLMDVSGSMGEHEKTLAKKFFLLFYLFLNKEYEKVDITFVRHTEDAKECTEQEFFYSTESGGTIVSEGLKLVNKIIDEKVDINQVNVYVAQASDGDNWSSDSGDCLEQLESLLQKVQYFAYVQVEDEYRMEMKKSMDWEDLYDLYKYVAQSQPKLNIKRVIEPEDVYPVLKELFAKE